MATSAISAQTEVIYNLHHQDRFHPYFLMNDPALNTGMETFPNIDPDWVWIAVCEDRITAALFTAPVYGYALLLRLNASPDAKPTTIRHLLGVALGHLRSRGITGFFTFLDAGRMEELKLARLIQHYGGHLLPFSGFMAVSKITRVLGD